MATQVQLRRGTSTQNDSFTGAQGELTFDTTNKRVRIHDGATAGGFELKTENAGGDTLFATGEKAIFGAGSDLQIYHDGSNSYIQDSGAGNLRILVGDLQIRNYGSNENVITSTANAEVSLYHNALPKLATTATGIDVTGNATFADNGKAIFGAGDDLQIYSDGSYSYLQEGSGTSGIRITSDNQVAIRKHDNEDIAVFNIDGAVRFYHDNAQKFSTTSTGIDVTGTAVMDGLTIGSSSISAGTGLFQQIQTAGNNMYVGIGSNNSAYVQANGEFRIATGGYADKVTVTTSGNVGIGTSSPSSLLTIHGSQPIITLSDSDTGSTSTISGNSGHLILNADSGSDASNNTIDFQIDNSQKMRIDSSGNLLVGKTNTGIGTAGIQAEATGQLNVTKSGDAAIRAIRLSSDGDIVKFYKDSTTVGSIGNASNNLVFYLAGTQNAVKLVGPAGGVDAFAPASTSGLNRDNAMDLGWSSNRFKDLYLSSSVKLPNCTLEDQVIKSNTFVFKNGAGTTEYGRFDSSGNMTVGKTSVNTDTTGIELRANNLLASTRVSAECLFLNRKTSDGDIAKFAKDGTTVGSIGVTASDIFYLANPDGTGCGLNFDGDSPKINPTNGSGAGTNGIVDLGWSGGRFKDAYLSGGVYLGGTGSANKLDDYEEGNFTPSLGASSANPSVGYSLQSGYYIKVGGLVTVWIVISLSSISGGSGNVVINGMPFTLRNDTAMLANQGGMIDQVTSDSRQISFQGDANTTRFLVISGGGSTGSHGGMGSAEFQASTDIRVCLQYSTAS